MAGYWKDAEENPFNMMSWTRGGGGYNNSLTSESNERRASASLNPVDQLPRFATMGVAQAALPAKTLAVVGDNVIRTSGPGSATSRTASGDAGTGPGVEQASTGKSGGAGSGSKFVIGGDRGVWWEKVGDAYAGPAKGAFVKVTALPALAPVMKRENTALMLGGEAFMPDPGTSNAAEIEDLLGDGDTPLDLAWYVKQYAAFQHLMYNHRNYVDNYPEVKGGDGAAKIGQWLHDTNEEQSQRLHRWLGTGVVLPQGNF